MSERESKTKELVTEGSVLTLSYILSFHCDAIHTTH